MIAILVVFHFFQYTGKCFGGSVVSSIAVGCGIQTV